MYRSVLLLQLLVSVPCGGSACPGSHPRLWVEVPSGDPATGWYTAAGAGAWGTFTRLLTPALFTLHVSQPNENSTEQQRSLELSFPGVGDLSAEGGVLKYETADINLLCPGEEIDCRCTSVRVSDLSASLDGLYGSVSSSPPPEGAAAGTRYWTKENSFKKSKIEKVSQYDRARKSQVNKGQTKGIRKSTETVGKVRIDRIMPTGIYESQRAKYTESRKNEVRRRVRNNENIPTHPISMYNIIKERKFHTKTVNLNESYIGNGSDHQWTKFRPIVNLSNKIKLEESRQRNHKQNDLEFSTSRRYHDINVAGSDSGNSESRYRDDKNWITKVDQIKRHVNIDHSHRTDTLTDTRDSVQKILSKSTGLKSRNTQPRTTDEVTKGKHSDESTSHTNSRRTMFSKQTRPSIHLMRDEKRRIWIIGGGGSVLAHSNQFGICPPTGQWRIGEQDTTNPPTREHRPAEHAGHARQQTHHETQGVAYVEEVQLQCQH